MGNLRSFEKLNAGFVLVTSLLLLLILTILAVSLLQNGLLTAKITTNYQDQVFALQIAEKNLLLKEQEIPTETNGISEISHVICGVKFYRVITSGEYHGTQIKLQSTYAVISDTSKCNPKPTIKPGRHSWRIAA
jgi:hypothetical protein